MLRELKFERRIRKQENRKKKEECYQKWEE